jgi:hypothetical protein
MTRKSKVRWAGGVVAVVVITIGLYAYGRIMRGPDTVLPTFTEPGAGPRAPAAELYGFHVGRTRLAEANARLKELGVVCENTSVRAVIEKMREAKRKEVEDKKAKGEDPDTVTGASIINHKSKREKNPQVRLSCENTPAKALGEVWLGDASGRLLLVFDSAEHPLRHISFARNHLDHGKALLDYAQTTKAYSRIYGTPKETQSKPGSPKDAPDAPNELARFERRAQTWEFSDLSPSVVIVNYSSFGPSITEALEVPWPVRPDAPALSAAPAPQAAN